jgi:DNA-binding NarL/FixJ family response regulator
VDVLSATSFEEVEQLVAEMPDGGVDLAIVDFVLGGQKNGIDVIRLIREAWPVTRAVLVSKFLNAALAMTAHRRAVLALPKPLDPLTLCELVRLMGSTGPSKRWVKEVFPTLTDREAEVLRLGATGLEDRVISAQLGVAAGTVKSHWTRIRKKTGQRSLRSLVGVLVAWLTRHLDLPT